MLTREDINNLAKLCRLELSETEAEKLQKDMGSILGYISELQNAPGVSESHQPENYPLRNVMRDDSEEYEPRQFTDVILSQAPKRKDDLFVVKRIL